MRFFDYLKNAFIIIVLIQLAPSLIDGIKKQYGKYIFPKTRFGIVEVKGVLYNSEKYIKHLQKYFKDETIKAILIKMECPGAASGTSYALFNEINRLKKEYPTKPVVTLVENICASGGYYIACATDAIVSPASSLIGSIGAQLPYLFQLQDFIEQYKIKYEAIKAGKYKSCVDPFINITQEDKQMLKHVIDDTYLQFVQDVVKARKVSLQDKEKWAEGRLFSGRQAHKLGLIDIVGSASDAVDIMKEKALVAKEREIEWVRPVHRRSLWSFFSGKENDEESGSMFSAFANQMCTTFENRYLTKRLF